MNKAVMISIAPKWWQMIKNGTKTLEFRNYGIPKGTKVYLRETLGDKVKCDRCSGSGIDVESYDEEWEKYEFCQCEKCEATGYYHEGTGLVVGEFIVGECYEQISCHALGHKATELRYNSAYGLCSDITNECVCEYDSALIQGYTNQSHAHKITDLIVYDEPIHWNEFVSWNKAQSKTCKYRKNNVCYEDINMGIGCHLDYAVGIGFGTFEEIYGKVMECCTNKKLDKTCKLTSPNQGKIYVVEKEWK